MVVTSGVIPVLANRDSRSFFASAVCSAADCVPLSVIVTSSGFSNRFLIFTLRIKKMKCESSFLCSLFMRHLARKTAILVRWNIIPIQQGEKVWAQYSS